MALRKAFLLLVCSMVWAMSSTAQTVTPTWYFTDGQGHDLGTKHITVTPILKMTVFGWTNIVAEPIPGKTTNGIFALTLLNGQAVRVELAGFDNWTQTNWFGTNVTGSVAAADYTTLSTNLGAGVYAYSQAAANALFQLHSTNLDGWSLLPTNLLGGGGTTYSNSTDSAGVVNGGTVGTNLTAYSLKTDFAVYSNFVSANYALQSTLASYVLLSSYNAAWGALPTNSLSGIYTAFAAADTVSSNGAIATAQSTLNLTNTQIQNTITSVSNALTLSINVKSLGAFGDCIELTNAVIASSSTTLTCTNATFSASDVGKNVEVVQGLNNGTNLAAKISAFINPSNVTLSSAAGVGISNAQCYYGHDDSAVFQAAVNAVVTNKGVSIFIPAGQYFWDTNYSLIPNSVNGNSWAMIQLPHVSFTSGTYAIDFSAPTKPSGIDNGIQFGCSMIVVARTPTNGANSANSITNACGIGFPNPLTDVGTFQFNALQVTMKNLLVRTFGNPSVQPVCMRYSGAFSFDCLIADVGLPYSVMPEPTWPATAIVTPTVANFNVSSSGFGQANGYSTAFELNELAHYNYLAAQWCKTGLSFYNSGHSVCIDKFFDFHCRTGMVATVTSSTIRVPISIGQFDGERMTASYIAANGSLYGPTWATNVIDIYDPSNSMSGTVNVAQLGNYGAFGTFNFLGTRNLLLSLADYTLVGTLISNAQITRDLRFVDYQWSVSVPFQYATDLIPGTGQYPTLVTAVGNTDASESSAQEIHAPINPSKPFYFAIANVTNNGDANFASFVVELDSSQHIRIIPATKFGAGGTAALPVDHMKGFATETNWTENADGSVSFWKPISAQTNSASFNYRTNDLVPGVWFLLGNARCDVTVKTYNSSTLTTAARSFLLYSNAATATVSQECPVSIPSGVLAAFTVTNTLVGLDLNPNSMICLSNDAGANVSIAYSTNSTRIIYK